MPKRTSKTEESGDARKLPPGVKLRRTLEGHSKRVFGVAFDPQGRLLATCGDDNTVRLWEAQTGKLLRTLEGHSGAVYSVAVGPQGHMLASGSGDNTVRLWEPQSGKLLRALEGHRNPVLNVAFDPQGHMIASGGGDNTVRLWEPQSGKLLRKLEGHGGLVFSVAFDPQGRLLATSGTDHTVRLWEPQSGKLIRTLEVHNNWVYSVAFDPQGRMLATGGDDNTVRLWETETGRLQCTLEGHTGTVVSVSFNSSGDLLATRSLDNTIRLWSCHTWEVLAIIPERTTGDLTAATFHPRLPWLAASGARSFEGGSADADKLTKIYEFDLAFLLGGTSGRSVATGRAVHHVTARIVLVGDSGVGKTGLGWRLAHGHFKEHASTHGQQFWVCDALGTKRRDGTECEAVLWDLAGQPDYRLIHSLFLDDADLALVLFDPTDARDPLHGVEFWLKQLNVGADRRRSQNGTRVPVLLVAGRCDRGDSRLTAEELEAFCRARGLAGYVRTSAFGGDGIDDLLSHMKRLVAWDDKPATVTTATFKRIKDYVLKLKQNETERRVIATAEELRARLEATDAAWRFTDDEMRTAVGHLETYGYVRRLSTSRGESRILLAPELLNNLAASFVLEARRNSKGLGALEERRLLGDGERYAFPEFASLAAEEQTILTDAAALLFIEHHACFRETDPLAGQSFVIFPELINLKRPIEEEKAPEEGAAYTVSGAVENVFASLVVLLGYTSTFTRIAHWQNNARYDVADGSVCGFRLAAERDGELDLALCFSPAATRPVRMLFQGLFENCLARRNLSVVRYDPVACGKCGSRLARSVVRQRLQEGKTFAFCNDCGEKLALSVAEEIQRTRAEQETVEQQRRQADARTRFEQAIFRVQAYVKEQGIAPPQCFISYAWGVKEHERWVEKSLATDLQKAGIGVVLDRWENAKVGAHIARFVERAAKADAVVVVGTLLYREKYETATPMSPYVLAAEGDIIGTRIVQRRAVSPILLEGTEKSSFPDLLAGYVYADFRNGDQYFIAAFNLILSLYDIAPNHPAVADLVESLQPDRLKM